MPALDDRLVSRVVPYPEPKSFDGASALTANAGDKVEPDEMRHQAIEPQFGNDEHASTEEKILGGLVDGELPLILLLERAKMKLGEKLLEMIDDPRRAFSVAKVLREVVGVSSVITKRVQNTTAAIATLRAQRRLLEQQAWRKK